MGLVAVVMCCALNAQSSVELLGAGATFPYPLYSKMFDVYNGQYGVKINYQSIGSGGGIRQLENKTIDFGATDAYVKDKKAKEMPGKIVHIPTCLGAVVVTYNLPNRPELKLTGAVLADIFLGKIKKWNDPRIAKLNPSVKLPSSGIVVVHRSDGSGTSFIFTDYLSKVSPEWKKKVGSGKSVKWPVGLGAKGNEGISGLVKQSKGSIGYCELAYALHNDMSTAVMKNAKGNFIEPSIASISAAAKVEMPEDTRVTFTNTEADSGYPLSSFTWLIVYKDLKYGKRSKEEAEGLVKLLWWMIHDGQKHVEPLDYAPLPAPAVEKAEAQIKSLVYDGKPLHK